MILLHWGLLAGGGCLLLLALFGRFDLREAREQQRLWATVWAGLVLFGVGAALLIWGGN